MANQTQSSNQQMILYALVAIAVLLAVLIGFMIYNNMQTQSNAASSTIPPTSSAGDIASKMPAAAQPVAFDPKTATKLAAGMTPLKALKAYMDDIKFGRYQDAYALLPLAQKNSYGSADAYAQQVKGYGITGYKIGEPTTAGADVIIVSEQDTPMMNIGYTWTYTKVGKDWFVKSRAMGAASAPPASNTTTP